MAFKWTQVFKTQRKPILVGPKELMHHVYINSNNCRSNIGFLILFCDHNLRCTNWFASNRCITYLITNKNSNQVWMSSFAINSFIFSIVNWRFSLFWKILPSLHHSWPFAFDWFVLNALHPTFVVSVSTLWFCVFTPNLCMNHFHKQRTCLGHTINVAWQ